MMGGRTADRINVASSSKEKLDVCIFGNTLFFAVSHGILLRDPSPSVCGSLSLLIL